MEIAKQTLGLAGEYAVASELCKRGIYAQLTLGNRKSTDLLLDVEDGGMLRVQVKSKQGNEWPACKGVACGNPEVLVFDEPMNDLDPATKRFLKELLLELNAAGKTILCSTHDFEYVKGIFKRAIVFSRDHSILRDAPYEEVMRDTKFLFENNII